MEQSFEQLTKSIWPTLLQREFHWCYSSGRRQEYPSPQGILLLLLYNPLQKKTEEEEEKRGRKKIDMWRRYFSFFFAFLTSPDGAVGLQYLLWTAFPRTSWTQSNRHHARNELHRPCHHRRIHVQGRNQRVTGKKPKHFHWFINIFDSGLLCIQQDQLGSLLRTAESLRVKGLAQASSGNGSNDANESHNNHLTSGNQSTMTTSQQQQQKAVSTAASSPTTPPPAAAGASNPPPFSPPPYSLGGQQQAPPPPALLPLFQNAALLSAAAVGFIWFPFINQMSAQPSKMNFVNSLILTLISHLNKGQSTHLFIISFSNDFSFK